MIYDLARIYVAAPIVRHILNPTVTGLENVPSTGAAVVVGNHIAEGDTFPVPILLRRRIYFPARQSLFTGEGLRGALLRFFLHISRQVPIDTSGGTNGAAALSLLIRLLRHGEMVGIFPEGTRSPDGRMYRFHTGVARLVLTAGVPVVPLACDNTHLHRGRLGLPSMKGGTLRFGTPLHFDEYFGRQDDPVVLRHVTDEIAGVIQQMTGQAYVDVYGSRVKSGELTLAQADAFARAHPGDVPSVGPTG